MGTKSNQVVKVEVTDTALTFSCIGHDGTATLTLADVSAVIINRAAVHGLRQRIQDAAAQSRDEVTGKPATPEEKFAAMKALVDHYMTGTIEWNVGRSGGTGTSGERALCVAAMTEAFPLTVDIDIREKVKGWTNTEVAAVLASAVIKPIADRMRAARVSSVNVDGLLATLK